MDEQKLMEAFGTTVEDFGELLNSCGFVPNDGFLDRLDQPCEFVAALDPPTINTDLAASNQLSFWSLCSPLISNASLSPLSPQLLASNGNIVASFDEHNAGYTETFNSVCSSVGPSESTCEGSPGTFSSSGAESTADDALSLAANQNQRQVRGESIDDSIAAVLSEAGSRRTLLELQSSLGTSAGISSFVKTRNVEAKNKRGIRETTLKRAARNVNADKAAKKPKMPVLVKQTCVKEKSATSLPILKPESVGAVDDVSSTREAVQFLPTRQGVSATTTQSSTVASLSSNNAGVLIGKLDTPNGPMMVPVTIVNGQAVIQAQLQTVQTANGPVTIAIASGLTNASAMASSTAPHVVSISLGGPQSVLNQQPSKDVQQVEVLRAAGGKQKESVKKQSATKLKPVTTYKPIRIKPRTLPASQPMPVQCESVASTSAASCNNSYQQAPAGTPIRLRSLPSISTVPSVCQPQQLQCTVIQLADGQSGLFIPTAQQPSLNGFGAATTLFPEPFRSANEVGSFLPTNCYQTAEILSNGEKISAFGSVAQFEWEPGVASSDVVSVPRPAAAQTISLSQEEQHKFDDLSAQMQQLGSLRAEQVNLAFVKRRVAELDDARREIVRAAILRSKPLSSDGCGFQAYEQQLVPQQYHHSTDAQEIDFAQTSWAIASVDSNLPSTSASFSRRCSFSAAVANSNSSPLASAVVQIRNSFPDTLTRLQTMLARDKLSLSLPCSQPFVSKEDAVNQLLPFHLLYEPNVSDSFLESVDYEFRDFVAQLSGRKKALHAKFQQILSENATRDVSSSESLLMTSLALESERVRLSEEESEREGLVVPSSRDVSDRLVGVPEDSPNSLQSPCCSSAQRSPEAAASTSLLTSLCDDQVDRMAQLNNEIADDIHRDTEPEKDATTDSDLFMNKALANALISTDSSSDVAEQQKRLLLLNAADSAQSPLDETIGNEKVGVPSLERFPRLTLKIPKCSLKHYGSQRQQKAVCETILKPAATLSSPESDAASSVEDGTVTLHEASVCFPSPSHSTSAFTSVSSASTADSNCGFLLQTKSHCTMISVATLSASSSDSQLFRCNNLPATTSLASQTVINDRNVVRASDVPTTASASNDSSSALSFVSSERSLEKGANASSQKLPTFSPTSPRRFAREFVQRFLQANSDEVAQTLLCSTAKKSARTIVNEECSKESVSGDSPSDSVRPVSASSEIVPLKVNPLRLRLSHGRHDRLRCATVIQAETTADSCGYLNGVAEHASTFAENTDSSHVSERVLQPKLPPLKIRIDNKRGIEAVVRPSTSSDDLESTGEGNNPFVDVQHATSRICLPAKRRVSAEGLSKDTRRAQGKASARPKSKGLVDASTAKGQAEDSNSVEASSSHASQKSLDVKPKLAPSNPQRQTKLNDKRSDISPSAGSTGRIRIVLPKLSFSFFGNVKQKRTKTGSHHRKRERSLPSASGNTGYTSVASTPKAKATNKAAKTGVISYDNAEDDSEQEL